jgi:hypothetical protein
MDALQKTSFAGWLRQTQTLRLTEASFCLCEIFIGINRTIYHTFIFDLSYVNIAVRGWRVDNNRYDNDTVLCECDLPTLQRFVEELEKRHEVKLVKAPGICLTMVRAEDSLEKQEFFLGEALTSECEVARSMACWATACA